MRIQRIVSILDPIEGRFETGPGRERADVSPRPFTLSFMRGTPRRLHLIVRRRSSNVRESTGLQGIDNLAEGDEDECESSC